MKQPLITLLLLLSTLYVTGQSSADKVAPFGSSKSEAQLRNMLPNKSTAATQSGSEADKGSPAKVSKAKKSTFATGGQSNKKASPGTQKTTNETNGNNNIQSTVNGTGNTVINNTGELHMPSPPPAQKEPSYKVKLQLQDSSFDKKTNTRYRKYLIKNEDSLPLKLTLRLPHGYYRDGVKVPANFVPMGETVVEKKILPSQLGYAIFNIPLEPIDEKFIQTLDSMTIHASMDSVAKRYLSNDDNNFMKRVYVSGCLTNEANYNLGKENFTEAISFYDQAIAQISTLRALKGRGTAYYFKKDFNKAIADLTAVVKVDTGKAGYSSGSDLFILGMSHYHKAMSEPESPYTSIRDTADFKLAYYFLSKSIKAGLPDSANSVAWLHVAKLAYRNQSSTQTYLPEGTTPDDIIRILDNAIKSNRHNAAALYWKAVVYFEMNKNNTMALFYIDQAITTCQCDDVRYAELRTRVKFYYDKDAEAYYNNATKRKNKHTQTRQCPRF